MGTQDTGALNKNQICTVGATSGLPTPGPKTYTAQYAHRAAVKFNKVYLTPCTTAPSSHARARVR
jgi:hypothetical protein